MIGTSRRADAPALVLRSVRLVPLDPLVRPGPDQSGPPVDVLIEAGRITRVQPQLTAPTGAREVSAAGRWLTPGLWDQHVHFTQWAAKVGRFDVSSADNAAEVVALVGAHIADGGKPGETGFLIGWGYRSGTWTERGSVARLDAVTGSMPVVLISGDGHNGWVNSAALNRLGLPFRDDVLTENEWFDAHTWLGQWPGAEAEAEAGVGTAVTALARKGVVGLVDLEFAASWEQWQARAAAGIDGVRVRTGVYADRLDEVLALQWGTGEPIPGTAGRVTMGPLKVIADGSLNTRTAWCCQPYAGRSEAREAVTGAPNQTLTELLDLVGRAHRGGLTSALHAIGDRAVAEVLQVFSHTGASGSIEHAQLLDLADLRLWQGLPVRASVQPAHLLDDREVTERWWPDRTDRTFALRTIHEHGIDLVMGSDAPVAPLDPWLAIAAAVHRGDPAGDPWHPEQSLTPQQALAASVDGARVRVGERADLVLLDADPLADGPAPQQAAALRQMPVAATLIDGRPTWSHPDLAWPLE